MIKPIDFLQEKVTALPKGVELLPLSDSPLHHLKPLYDEISGFLERYTAQEDFSPLCIVLVGEKGSGKKFLAAKLADSMGLSALKVDCSFDLKTEELNLAVILYAALPCVVNADHSHPIKEILNKTGIAIAIYESFDNVADDFDCVLLKRELPQPDIKSRKILYQTMLSSISLPQEIKQDSSFLSLNPGQLQAFASQVFAEQIAAQKPLSVKMIRHLLREARPLSMAGAVKLECSGSLCDLALPCDLSRQLCELCAFAKMRETVYKSWGFGEIPWGHGISALFYGAPGTGKTMAAAVIANEVGLPLMRVDISQITSKYIGETQKNIGKIFDDAAKSDCILFFDEADAIFTKRTESSDAQDKYANAETAYLLQRMESHDGICILATNLLKNFDEAFRRRIGYMFHFPLPDAVLREKIWRGIFPDEAPVDVLDYTLLAEQLELSGASIKNSAVHAAYLAAMNNTSITMQYIFAGAKNEYQKQGKSLSPQITQLFTI